MSLANGLDLSHPLCQEEAHVASRPPCTIKFSYSRHTVGHLLPGGTISSSASLARNARDQAQISPQAAEIVD